MSSVAASFIVALVVDVSAFVYRDFERALTHFAKKSTLSFCDAIYKTFPRELRDMIYEAYFPAVQDGTVTGMRVVPANADPAMRTAYFDQKSVWETPQFSTLRDDERTLFDPDFSGHFMAREACEHLYRIILWVFRLRDLDQVDRFLAYDVFQLKILPRDYVRQVRIEVNANDWALDPSDTLRRLKNALESFSHLKSAAVTITIEGSYLEKHIIETMLRQLAAQMYKLKELGCNVGIYLRLSQRLNASGITGNTVQYFNLEVEGMVKFLEPKEIFLGSGIAVIFR